MYRSRFIYRQRAEQICQFIKNEAWEVSAAVSAGVSAGVSAAVLMNLMCSEWQPQLSVGHLDSACDRRRCHLRVVL